MELRNSGTERQKIFDLEGWSPEAEIDAGSRLRFFQRS
jgi:hypothetical protein